MVARGAGDTTATFQMISTPTPLQARALELLGLPPASV
jgi:hypothetical protein